MILRFRNASLQALCNSEAALRQRWGRKRARTVAQRLQELDAVDCLGDLRHLPRVGVTVGDDSREITLRIEAGLELCLILGRDSSGAVWEAATEATIVRIRDASRPRRARKGR